MKRPARPLTNEDGEVPALTKDDIRLFRPIAEVDPGMIDDMARFRRRIGRPKAVAPKVLIGFRLSADVVASIRASGRGYNARVERILREAGFGGTDARAKPPTAADAKNAAVEARLSKRGGGPQKSKRLA